MTDTSKQGTGHEFLRLDLGKVGELVIVDDGAHDPDTDIRLLDASGNVVLDRRPSHFHQFRSDQGDAAFEAALLGGQERHEQTAAAQSTHTSYGVGHFVCDDCHRTWPSKRNQTPDGTTDTCPECV